MQDGRFELREERDGARLVLVACGEIDMATAPALGEAIARGLDEAGELWVDLREVGFLDSTGLTALVTGHRAGRLVVICPDGPARRSIEVCGLQDVLRLYDDRRTADARSC